MKLQARWNYDAIITETELMDDKTSLLAPSDYELIDDILCQALDANTHLYREILQAKTRLRNTYDKINQK